MNFKQRFSKDTTECSILQGVAKDFFTNSYSSNFKKFGFLILTTQRSGSTLLFHDLLSSLNVESERKGKKIIASESFIPLLRSAFSYKNGDTIDNNDFEQLVRRGVATDYNFSNSEAIVHKVMASYISKLGFLAKAEVDNDSLIDHAINFINTHSQCSEELVIIFLKRDNLIRQAISHIINDISSKNSISSHFTDAETIKDQKLKLKKIINKSDKDILFNKLLNKVVDINSQNQFISQVCNNLKKDFKVIRLSYEDDLCKSASRSIQKINSTLEVDILKTENIQRSLKKGSSNINESLYNLFCQKIGL